MFRIVLTSLALGPLLAWWPWRMPGPVRKAAACVTLAPVALAFGFVAFLLVSRPRLVIVPAAPILLALGVMLVAGAYALWPRALSRRQRVVAALLFVGPGLALFAVAAGVAAARGGTVFGRVTVKGQPVPSGTVSVMSEGGVVCTGVIRPDGWYSVYRVPPGPVRIAVATHPSPPPGLVPVPARPYVAIPARYRDFDKSRLTRMVTGGGQRQDLDLQP